MKMPVNIIGMNFFISNALPEPSEANRIQMVKAPRLEPMSDGRHRRLPSGHSPIQPGRCCLFPGIVPGPRPGWHIACAERNADKIQRDDPDGRMVRNSGLHSCNRLIQFRQIANRVPRQRSESPRRPGRLGQPPLRESARVPSGSDVRAGPDEDEKSKLPRHGQPVVEVPGVCRRGFRLLGGGGDQNNARAHAENTRRFIWPGNGSDAAS